MMTIENILEDNEKKLRQMEAPYDPLTGVGSPVKRVPLYYDDIHYTLIPCEMARQVAIDTVMRHGSESRFALKSGLDRDSVSWEIMKIRMVYDFEFWGASSVMVQDKQTKKMVPFVMRKAQLKLFKLLYETMIADEPIRVILLKARQWGGSTLTQIFMAWIQVFHRTHWHSVIVGDIEDQSRNIRAMYSRMAQHHPKEVFDIQFQNFEGSTKNKKMLERESITYLSSMQRPDSIRSADVMMAHLSEVGLWRATEGKKPEDVVQSIAGTIPLEPYTLIVMESTAKGVGNYFHRQWCGAVAKENGYSPLFVAWFEIDIYTRPFSDEMERKNFAKTLSEEEKEYFRLGATLEGINWYRNKMYTDGYDKWRMCCEFPSTPLEAFQSTGRRAHPAHYISSMRRHSSPPLVKGDLVASALHGVGAIDSTLHFEACESGDLWLWKLPDPRKVMKRQYVVSMDIGGRAAGADWSVISVIDRYWLSKGGVEECIATARFHLDQDLAVWKAVQVAKFFHNAMLVVEANSLNPKDTDGDHTLTILDEIKDHYTNIYCRTDPQKIHEGSPARFGFFTSKASKSDLVNQMNRRFREGGHIERDCRALDEADCYEIKDDGSYGAVEGSHDDIYMSRAIGLKASSIMDLPI